jgi:hypothetical protein
MNKIFLSVKYFNHHANYKNGYSLPLYLLHAERGIIIRRIII